MLTSLALIPMSVRLCRRWARSVVTWKPPTVPYSLLPEQHELRLPTVPRSQMYAWSVASAQSEQGPLDYQLKDELMLQPPFDMTLERVSDLITCCRPCKSRVGPSCCSNAMSSPNSSTHVWCTCSVQDDRIEETFKGGAACGR